MIKQTDPGTAMMSQVRFEDLRMVTRELWEKIRRLQQADGLSVSALARRCLRDTAWHPYQRRSCAGAPEVNSSAQILFQELRAKRGYRGNYDTVKRFVVPLRTAASQGDLCQTRLETPPGWQTQIDWGQSGSGSTSGAWSSICS